MKISGTCAVIAGVLVAVICSSAPRAAAQEEPLVACVKPGTGLLRILAPGESCKPQEIPLAFDDFPLLVALRATVAELQARVQDLDGRLTALENCIASTIPVCSAE